MPEDGGVHYHKPLPCCIAETSTVTGVGTQYPVSCDLQKLMDIYWKFKSANTAGSISPTVVTDPSCEAPCNSEDTGDCSGGSLSWNEAVPERLDPEETRMRALVCDQVTTWSWSYADDCGNAAFSIDVCASIFDGTNYWPQILVGAAYDPAGSGGEGSGYYYDEGSGPCSVSVTSVFEDTDPNWHIVGNAIIFDLVVPLAVNYPDGALCYVTTNPTFVVTDAGNYS